MKSEVDYRKIYNKVFLCGLSSIQELWDKIYPTIGDLNDKLRFLEWLSLFSSENGEMPNERYVKCYLDDLKYRYIHKVGKDDPSEFIDAELDWIPSSQEDELRKQIGDELYKYYYHESGQLYAKIEESIVFDNLSSYGRIINEFVPARLASIKSQILHVRNSVKFIGTAKQKSLLFTRLKSFYLNGQQFSFIAESTKWKDFNIIFGDGGPIPQEIPSLQWVAISKKSKQPNMKAIHDLFYLLREVNLLPLTETKSSHGYVDKIHNLFARKKVGENSLLPFSKGHIRKSDPGEINRSAAASKPMLI